MLIIAQTKSASTSLLKTLERVTKTLGVPHFSLSSELTTINKMEWSQREVVFQKLDSKDLDMISLFHPDKNSPNKSIPKEVLLYAIETKHFIKHYHLDPIPEHIEVIKQANVPCVLTSREPIEAHKSFMKVPNIRKEYAQKNLDNVTEYHDVWKKISDQNTDKIHRVTFDQLVLGSEQIIKDVCKLWELDIKDNNLVLDVPLKSK